MISSLLISQGHKVKYVLCGEEAIELIKKEEYDFILQDFILPGIRGMELLSEIRNISPESKVIIVSGSYLDEETLLCIKEKGASEFIQKPFNLKTLIKAVQKSS